MATHTLLFSILLLGLWGCLAHDLNADNGHPVLPLPQVHPLLYRNNIPARCVASYVADVSCAGVGEDQLLPHPADCELFYYCVGDVAICRQCPAGLHFNPIKHVCDYANRAGCRQ
ncbi:PREDICTED: peritrophin-1-like [Papilio xuthus]|uniref:Endochitinase n=1 Tax=Papilio xuthus TaxID=66420 RepID=A0A194Q811_PAPXU|nr:PREDICTED: peritrophin-1-like [Papilio xuthus]KPI99545.1 Endochitinase [Papilio xuthus]